MVSLNRRIPSRVVFAEVGQTLPLNSARKGLLSGARTQFPIQDHSGIVGKCGGVWESDLNLARVLTLKATAQSPFLPNREGRDIH